MLIQVVFAGKDWPGSFEPKPYTYRCDLPNVKIGDRLIVTAQGEEKEVMVTGTNILASSVPAHIYKMLKTITKRKEDAGK